MNRAQGVGVLGVLLVIAVGTSAFYVVNSGYPGYYSTCCSTYYAYSSYPSYAVPNYAMPVVYVSAYPARMAVPVTTTRYYTVLAYHPPVRSYYTYPAASYYSYPLRSYAYSSNSYYADFSYRSSGYYPGSASVSFDYYSYR